MTKKDDKLKEILVDLYYRIKHESMWLMDVINEGVDKIKEVFKNEE